MSEEQKGTGPRSFDEVIGHTLALDTLRRAFESGRAHHAYLFDGPSGVGKRTVADLTGRSLLCERDRLGHPCGECGECRRVLVGSHPDFIVLEPEGQFIKIEAVRRLSHAFAFRSFEGGRRVVLVDPADRLTEEAANALLKTLEEPPVGSFFFVITANRSQLLPTIVSRCQHLPFSPLSSEDVARVLGRLGLRAAAVAARYSGGSPGRAAGLAADPVFARREELFQLFSRLARSAPGAPLALDLGDWAEGSGGKLQDQRGRARDVLALLKILLRDLMLVKAGGDHARLVNQDQLGRVVQTAAELTWPELSAMLEALRAAEEAVEGNVTPRLALERLAAQVMEAGPARP
jgi:DNA polymerase III subunit delta'